MVDDIDRRIGLECLCEAGLNPVDYVKLAAGAGARSISILPRQLDDYNPLNHPHWSLLEDRALRRELRQAMADHGVAIGLGEGLPIYPGQDVEQLKPVIDLFAELGAVQACAVPLDPDMARCHDQFARLAEWVGAAGIGCVIEFSPLFAMATIDQALAAIAHAGGADRARLLVDTLHFTRAGHRPEALEAVDPALFGYVQICDAPLTGAPNYYPEALEGRLPPGEGEIPLVEIVRRLPAHLTVSAEVPQLALARAGMPAAARLKHIVEATRAVLHRAARA